MDFRTNLTDVFDRHILQKTNSVYFSNEFTGFDSFSLKGFLGLLYIFVFCKPLLICFQCSVLMFSISFWKRELRSVAYGVMRWFLTWFHVFNVLIYLPGWYFEIVNWFYAFKCCILRKYCVKYKLIEMQASFFLFAVTKWAISHLFSAIKNLFSINNHDN